jgi:hypothetical protein
VLGRRRRFLAAAQSGIMIALYTVLDPELETALASYTLLRTDRNG